MSENENVQELLSKVVKDLSPEQRAALAAELARQDELEAGKVGAARDELMAEYRKLTANIPRGIAGHDARFKVQRLIRQKAASMGVESPV